MNIRRKRKRQIQSAMLNVLAVLLTFLFIFPVLWLVSGAFKPGGELFSHPMTFLPRNPTLDNIIDSLTGKNYGIYFGNTILVTVTATVLTLIVNSMAGFALAKYRYRWVGVVFIFFLSSTMLPTIVIMAPSFEVIKTLGLYDKLLGIILPTIGSATGVFLMRQFFLTVPDSYIESARIDGASEGSIFLRIMVPLSQTTLAILTIFSFKWRWNDYVWPLLVIFSPKKNTIQLALSNLAGELNIDWTSLLAASFISMLPVLVVFVVFQKQLISMELGSGEKG